MSKGCKGAVKSATVTGLPDEQAMKRDALILAMLRCGPGDIGQANDLPRLMAFFRQWEAMPTTARRLFVRHAMAAGRFLDIDDGGVI